MRNETGSLRIGRSAQLARPVTGGMENIPAPGGTLPTEARLERPYLARLVMLVPAEVISLYVAMKVSAANFLPAFGLICLILVIVVRSKATWANGRPEWGSVGISAVSFGLWIYTIGGSLPLLPSPADPGIISVAIAVWTFVAPYFYQGEKPAPA